MAENKDNEDLLPDMELGDLGDFGDIGNLSDADLDAFLNDDTLNNGLDTENMVLEFDGLMDLSDFEELGSSENMAGMDDLLGFDSDWNEDLTGESKSSEEQPEDVLEANFPEKTVSQESEAPDGIPGVMDIKKAEPKKMAEPVTETATEEAADPGIEDFIDLDAMAMPEDGLENIPFKDEAENSGEEEQDEIEDILNMGGAFLEENPELAGIEDVNDELLLDVPEPDKKQKKKKSSSDGNVSIWKKLFGNVPDENAEKNAAKEAKRQAEKEAKKASKKTKEEIALEKQEKQKAKQEAADAKKAEQDAKKAQKAEAKKLKLAEKAAAKEARELEEAQEPPTRINRIGAGIILVTFAVIAVVIIVGNNSYAYSQCIAKATAYFGQKEYTNAYNEIYGVKVKKSDEEIKDQVMTVMFIEKQRNSFDNYFAMEMYPEALDSLLKGLDKYDKYLDQARSLGIESDLDYVKDEILAELKSAFNISEKRAYQLLSISDARKYTEAVTEASGAK